jgi:signal peptidase II
MRPEINAPPLPLRTRLLTLIPLVAGVIALDLLTKTLIFSAAGARIAGGKVVEGRVIEIIPGFFELQCVMNPGAFSGWFGQWFWFLVVVSFAAFAAIVGYVAAGKIRRLLFVVSLSFIAGGTAGNLYDRLVFGAVRDFFHFYIPRSGGSRLSWPNFNVADASICLGVGLWILIELTSGTDRAAASPRTPRR